MFTSEIAINLLRQEERIGNHRSVRILPRIGRNRVIGSLILVLGTALAGCASQAPVPAQSRVAEEAPAPVETPTYCDLGPNNKGYMVVNGVPYGFIKGGSGLDYNRMCTTPEYLKNN